MFRITLEFTSVGWRVQVFCSKPIQCQLVSSVVHYFDSRLDALDAIETISRTNDWKQIR